MRKRRRKKSKKLVIKLTHRQFMSLASYCMANKTTPNKLIKHSIKPYTSLDIDLDKVEEQLCQNQMNIFDIIED